MSLLLVGILMVAMGLLWTKRKSIARSEVDRLVERADLPPDPDLVAAALRWHERRQDVSLLGALIGAILAGVVVLLAELRQDDAPFSAARSDARLLIWVLAIGTAAGGVATLLHGYQTVRASRSDGPRTATLRQRRLSDYLSPVEIAAHYGIVGVPLVAVALGVVVLGSADHAERGWILVGSGLAGVVLWAAGLLLQRMALRVNQASGGQTELLWQEALRAATMRDLGSTVIVISWLLGASILLAFEWPSDVPGFAKPLSQVLVFASLAVLVLVGRMSVSRRGLQRVQRVAG